MSPSPVRLDKESLFADLGYLPHPGQLEVHRSRALRRVLACGSRWGKSTCAAMEAVAAALDPRDVSKGWVVGPTYELAQLIYQRVLEVLEKKLAHRIVAIVPREHRIQIRNLSGGLSEIRARSADNPDSLLGEGLDWVVVDEAARLKASIWEEHLSQRLIDRGGWALLLSTPRGKNWFHKLYKRGQGKDPDFASWRCPSWTNPHLDREVIEREKGRLDEAAYLAEYGAEFVGNEIDRCDVCGDPDPEASGMVVLTRDEELVSCWECGNPVSKNGRAVRGVMNGEPRLDVVHLFPGRGEVALPFETSADPALPPAR